MTPYSFLPDYADVRGNDFFWKATPHPRDHAPAYLLPGQTDWFGPIPFDAKDGFYLRQHRRDADCLAAMAARDGVHLHVQTVGEYIRTHRLREGPAKKLSDWRQLSPGSPMLLNPHPTADDVEKALNRVKYMHYNGFGEFRSWTDDAGALWVERL